MQTSLQGWDQHTDASGRAFLCNGTTGETRWLWNKWALNGRVFCVNALTNDRVWQEDMPPDLRVAAGIPPPPVAPPSERTKAVGHMLYDRGVSMRTASGATERNVHLSNSGRLSNEFGGRLKRQRLQRNEFVCAVCSVSFGSLDILRAHIHSEGHVRMANGKQSSESDPAARVIPQASAGLLRSQQHFPSLSGNDLQREHRSYISVLATGVSRPSSEVRPSRFGPATAPQPRLGTRKPPASPKAHAIPPQRRLQKFGPSSLRAKGIHAAITLGLSDSSEKSKSVLRRTALLYERDFAPEVSTSSGVSFDSEEPAGSVSTGKTGAIIGTCTVVEKRFLRLTSAPNPEDVRPLHVLKRALKLVKRSWSKQLADYEWVCSQLKSIRQDMKVQHIETAEALDTYETHARIALENGDFGEFNTCVAQLTELYTRVDRLDSVRDEFTCYRVLYNVLVGETETEFTKWLQQTPVVEQKRPATAFAIQVRRTVVDGNYSVFFHLYANPPQRTMVTFLLDHMLQQIRSRALAVMCHAYSPGCIPLAFVCRELLWIDRELESHSCDNKTDSVVFLKDCGGVSHGEELDSLIVNVRDVLRFCEEIGVVVRSSGKSEPVPFVIDAKASKLKGVTVLRKRRGLITAAGAQ